MVIHLPIDHFDLSIFSRHRGSSTALELQLFFSSSPILNATGIIPTIWQMSSLGSVGAGPEYRLAASNAPFPKAIRVIDEEYPVFSTIPIRTINPINGTEFISAITV
jgi:hypothetical protein